MHSLNILFVKNCHYELKFKTISFVLFYIELTLIINRGNILVNEETESVVNKTETKVWQCSFKDIKEISYIKSKYRVSREQHHKGVVDMRIISDVKPCENAVETSANLEEAYLKIIGNKRNDTNEKS